MAPKVASMLICPSSEPSPSCNFRYHQNKSMLLFFFLNSNYCSCNTVGGTNIFLFFHIEKPSLLAFPIGQKQLHASVLYSLIRTYIFVSFILNFLNSYAGDVGFNPCICTYLHFRRLPLCVHAIVLDLLFCFSVQLCMLLF